MRGSIAIWHDTFANDAEGYSPRVEIHINIWRNKERNQRGQFDLFDIGLRFEEFRALRTLSISLPFEIRRDEDVSDLFEIMHDAPTLSAIFNETLAAGGMQDGGRTFSVSHTETERIQFYVASCPINERQISTIGSGVDRVSVITLSDEFFSRLRIRVGDHYVRLRVKVPIGTKNGFVSLNGPKDSAFLSTISTNEIIEFRLNERRNFSTAIRERLQANDCALIDISAVHYFLIRDMGVEMTQSHTAFKKMRRLEPDMWERYLENYCGFNPDKMIIYHWASFAPSANGSVESFTALATFRAYYTGSLWIYGLVIVALGAMGSATQGLFTGLLSIYFEGSSYGCADHNATTCGITIWNALLLILLIGLLAILVVMRRREP
ncbi:hypothetical protein [Prosthecodimorpha hirschii]|uniref:hypothetical protein n=1 Tax=Prosthecodimorpha hirschii TaxID=665126 RepID=UPI00112E6B1A|nr:hypothetical protein [Prosthecomicrobium hirschii]